VTTISVCVSTHERPQALTRALECLAAQTRPADEIVIADSSGRRYTETLVRDFAAGRPTLGIRYLASARRALPWNRWLAFTHSSGAIVLFLDDDVQLAPAALLVLEQAYERLGRVAGRRLAGVGFVPTWEDGRQPVRNRRELRERWLGISRLPSGVMTPGGMPVSWAGLRRPAEEPVAVSHFWGGAMSFRREVLLRVGFLDRLAGLYDAGIGRAEDIVCSAYAGQYGDLYLITQPLAFHPHGPVTAVRPYAIQGWRLGLAQTWGRAHTLRWTAADRSAYRRALLRVFSLELARGAAWIVRRPWRLSAWGRLAGACYGVARTVKHWRSIPASPRSGAELSAPV
jgi:glycosyltransferase involved in cell wall biosynthesis